MVEGGNGSIVDVVNNLVPPLRKEYRHNGNYGDTIGVPYPGCTRCTAIANGALPSEGTIGIYDLLYLARIIGSDRIVIDDGFFKNEPARFDIHGCGLHLGEVIKEIYDGTFRYEEFGMDPLILPEMTQVLMVIKEPGGNGAGMDSAKTHYVLSYPVHPTIDQKIQPLRDYIESKRRQGSATVPEQYGISN